MLALEETSHSIKCEFMRLNVKLELSHGGEALTTDGADERLFAVVDTRMGIECTHPKERLSTDCAETLRVRLGVHLEKALAAEALVARYADMPLLAVDGAVSHKVLARREQLAADVADVRVLLRVHSRMLLEVRQLAEALATDGADKRALLGLVYRHVVLQCHLLRKRLATRETHVRPLPGVDEPVALEVARVVERHTTDVAAVQLLTAMCLDVGLEAATCDEALTTSVAYERTLLQMVHEHVTLEYRRDAEPTATSVAQVRLDGRVRRLVDNEVALELVRLAADVADMREALDVALLVDLETSARRENLTALVAHVDPILVTGRMLAEAREPCELFAARRAGERSLVDVHAPMDLERFDALEELSADLAVGLDVFGTHAREPVPTLVWNADIYRLFNLFDILGGRQTFLDCGRGICSWMIGRHL